MSPIICGRRLLPTALRAAALLCTFILLAGRASAQEPPEYIFNQKTINDGLASNFINCLYRDKKGFLWVGSENGLQRYDGNKFISPYRGLHEGALPPFPVHQVLEDKDGRLWLRMNNRIGIFNPINFTFTVVPVQAKNPLPQNGEHRLYKDAKGNVFLIISRFGWFYYDAASNRLREDKTPFVIPADWGLRRVVEDRETGKYWITGDKGLGLYDAQTKQLYSYAHNPVKHPLLQDQRLTKHVTNFFIDHKRRYWIVAWDLDNNKNGGQKFFCYDERSKAYTRDTLGLGNAAKGGYFEASHISEFADTVVVVYGKNCMVMNDGDRFEALEDPLNTGFGIRFNTVSQVLQDREDLLWVATDNGLYTMPLKRGQSRHILLRQNNGIVATFNALEETSTGRIWLGTWGRGVLVRDSALGAAGIDIYKNAPDDGLFRLVWDIEEHSSGTIWIACQSGRLMVYDTVKGKTDYLIPSIFNARTIRQVEQDRKGHLWFATQGGQLVKWNNGTDYSNKAFREVAQLGVIVDKLYFDREGMLWIATQGKGAIRMDPQTEKIIGQYGVGQYQAPYSESVQDLVQVNDSLFCLAGDVLNIWNVKKGTVVQTIHHNHEMLQGNLAVQIDNQGMIWVSTSTGIYKCNLQNGNVIKYSQWDGLVTVSNHSFLMEQGMKLRNGHIIFAGNHNLVRFDPSTFHNKTAPPAVAITDFRLHDRFLPIDSLMKLERLNLETDQNSMTFDFSALSFSPQSKLTYYYMLEGADKDWIKVQGLPLASYTLLPPGSYTFKVKAANEEGVESKTITELRIYIAPPFWQTPWFIAAVILVFGGLAYYWHRMRIERLLQVERVRTRLARDLHDDMGSTLSSINILSNMAIKRIENDQVVTKDYMVKISDNSSRMMEAMDDIVWSINPVNDTMRKMLARMKEFAGDVLEARDIEYRFEADETVKDTTFNMDQRREIFLIFKESINNIVKYAQATEVRVVMRQKGRQFIMQIIDNGVGFDYTADGQNSARRGNGMRNMQKRAETVKGTLTIESARQSGTMIELRMPVA